MGLRVVPVHERLGEVNSVSIGEGEKVVRLGRIDDERLLAENMLSGQNRSTCPVRMQVVGQRDVDAVDRWVVQQLVITLESPRNAVVEGELLGGRTVAGCNGGKLVRI